MKRAHEQSLVVNHLETSRDSFIFSVQGLSGEYLIEIHEDVNVWPPRCDCDDNYWRPDILCKHIILVLALMGVDERKLADCCWEPQQDELYKYLACAADCVGCTMSQHRRSSKHKS